LRWWNRRLFEEGDQVDQAERAADDHAGAVGGKGRVALSGLEEDDQGAGVVAADPGVDAVALAGGDVEDDRGRGVGWPGGGALGRVEAGDPDPAAGDRLEARPEERVAGDEQDRLCHGPTLPPKFVARMAQYLASGNRQRQRIPDKAPRAHGAMLRG
jgi:hypothetical protein